MTEEPKKTIDDWPFIMREYPFVRKGMTEEEYFKEKEYYSSMSIEDLKSGSYTPLWKQK